ncbi:MAG TPA: hypothetical protein PK573_11395 [Spirochaetota bacterium]|nr:hypothetical protein [Spirochaetota bacterium]HRZ28963.1 hypothetical protein [Spirochaetota bacterium]
MTAEKIFPNYRKIYYYSRGNSYISFRVTAPGSKSPLQFMHFDTAEQAELYFMENYL